jgi:hypothetical protein
MNPGCRFIQAASARPRGQQVIGLVRLDRELVDKDHRTDSLLHLGGQRRPFTHFDFWTLHDLPHRGKLDRPEVGCVLVEREMCTRLMVIGEVASQDVAEVSLAEDEHVIQTLA